MQFVISLVLLGVGLRKLFKDIVIWVGSLLLLDWLVASLQHVVLLNELVKKHDDEELVLLLDAVQLKQDVDVRIEAFLHGTKNICDLLLVLEV